MLATALFEGILLEAIKRMVRRVNPGRNLL
jgi:hypothetical protein